MTTIEKLYKMVIRRWELIKKAGLGGNISERVEERIQINMKKYNH